MAPTLAKTDTRDLILDATDRLMGRYGFRKMTMDDVAREAGVSRRTIYTYFPSKEELGLSSIGRVVEDAHSRLEELASSSLEVEDKLRQMLEVRVMTRVKSVGEYHHSLDELFEAVRPAYMERRQRYFLIERELIEMVLTEGRREGRFKLDDPEQAAENLLLSTNAFLPYSLSVRELGEPAEIQKRLRSMIELLLRGLTNPSEI